MKDAKKHGLFDNIRFLQLTCRAGTIQLSSDTIGIMIYRCYYKVLAGGEISVTIILQVNLGVKYV